MDRDTIDLGDGWTINIYPDECGAACDPTDWDGSASFALAHGRYGLRDDFGLRTEDYSGWSEVKDAIVEIEHALIILPVYMMDHSGVALSTTPFGCPWDSGQIGFVYLTVDDLTRWGFKGVEDYPGGEDALIGDLARQVKHYGEWLNGEVYGYTVEDADGTVHDSCWGFVGSDASDYMIAQAQDAAKYLMEQARADA